MQSLLTNFAATCNAKAIGWIPTWYKYLEGEPADPNNPASRCEVKFNPETDVGLVLLAIVEMILRIGVLVAIGFVIYGGFQYMISQGEPDKTKNARTTIINAVIGLVIATLGTVIVNFVGGRLISGGTAL